MTKNDAETTVQPIDLTDWLVPGSGICQVTLVEDRHTAPHVGSGLAPVLATPVLVNLFEAAALAVIEDKLPPGMQSLGTRLDIKHTAATPTQMQVEVSAILKKIEGRNLTFELVARDEVEQIGSGSHQRVVVDRDKFIHRVQSKANRQD